MKPFCRVCNNPAVFFMKKEAYELYRCDNCGLVFVHPQPAATFLKEEIYSLKSGYQGNKARDLSQLIPTKNQKKILGFFETQKRGSVLDVGCSSGDMMYFLKQKGFAPQGVELNERTAAIARENGFEIFGDFVEKAPYASKSFDYILLGDIIEHVTDPRQFLETCKKLLKDTGMIVVVTPNLDCYWSKTTLLLWKSFGIPWSSVTPPHHLFQFSTGNLPLLLNQVGFTIEKIWYNPSPRLMYELGSLHLLRSYKKHKTFGDACKVVFGFSLYIVVYGLYRLIRPYLNKDNGIVIAARNHHD